MTGDTSEEFSVFGDSDLQVLRARMIEAIAGDSAELAKIEGEMYKRGICPPQSCDSTYKIGAGTILQCAQHLGSSRNWKHSARHLGMRWYWTTAEADQQHEAMG